MAADNISRGGKPVLCLLNDAEKLRTERRHVGHPTDGLIAVGSTAFFRRMQLLHLPPNGSRLAVTLQMKCIPKEQDVWMRNSVSPPRVVYQVLGVLQGDELLLWCSGGCKGVCNVR